MTRISTRVCSALLAIAAAACSTPAPTEGALRLSDLVGRYGLDSIGGRALPVTLPLQGPPRYVVRADTLWLRADATYEEHMAREVIGPAPLTLTGTFRVDGARVLLTADGGTPVPARVVASALTIGEAPAIQWVYHRQCLGATC